MDTIKVRAKHQFAYKNEQVVGGKVIEMNIKDYETKFKTDVELVKEEDSRTQKQDTKKETK